jgi:hypothetical protein
MTNRLEMEYYKELEMYSNVDDNLRDYFGEQVDRLVHDIHEKSYILNGIELDEWYIEYFEPLAHALLNEIDEYVAYYGYKGKVFETYEDLATVLLDF